MTQKTRADDTPPDTVPDIGFKRAIMFSSAILLAGVFGWLACLVRTKSGEVEFHWQWRALIWIAAGLGCTFYFWRQVWPAQNDARPFRRQIKGWVILGIPCVIWMAYPLWFISGRNLSDVVIGLALAVAVLTGGGCMLYRLIRAFEAEGTPPPIGPVPARPPDPATPGADQASLASPSKWLGRDA